MVEKECRHVGEIVRVTIENFKTFIGRHSIETIRSLSCIVGPNGAGKSNFMEALCFALSVPTKVLRAKRLKDFVPHELVDRATSGDLRIYVEIALIRDGMETVFRRTLYACVPRSGGASTSRFHVLQTVNKDRVSLDVYAEKLRELHVDVSARNFLVFQGDVASLGACTSNELLDFMENLCGNRQCAMDYGSLELKKKCAEEVLKTALTKKKCLEARKSRLALDAAQREEFHAMCETKTQLQRQLSLFNLYSLCRKVDNAMQRVTRARRKSNASRGSDDSDDLDDAPHGPCHHGDAPECDVKRLRDERIAAQAHVESLHRRLRTLDEQTEQTTATLSEKTANEKVLERKMGHLISAYDTARTRKRALEDAIKALEEDKGDLERRIADGQTREAELDTRMQTLMVDKHGHDISIEFATLRMRTAPLVRTALDDIRDVEALIADHGDDEGAIKDAIMFFHEEKLYVELDAVALGAELHNKKCELAEAHSENQRLTEDMVAIQEQVRNATARLDALHPQKKALVEYARMASDHARRIDQRRQILENTLPFLQENMMAKNMEQFEANNDAVCGTVCQLCRPCRSEFKAAMTKVMQDVWDAVVCRDRETALWCFRALKEHRLPPVQLLSMECAPASNDAELRRALSTVRIGRPRLAMDCVSLKHEKYMPLFASLFARTIIVDDMTSAITLAREDLPTHNGRCTIVTLHGDVVHTDGSIQIDTEIAHPAPTSFSDADIEAAKTKTREVCHSIRLLQSSLMQLTIREEDLRNAIAHRYEHIEALSEQERRLTRELAKCRYKCELFQTNIEQGEKDLVEVIDVTRRSEEYKAQLEHTAQETLSGHFQALSERCGVHILSAELALRLQRQKASREVAHRLLDLDVIMRRLGALRSQHADFYAQTEPPTEMRTCREALLAEMESTKALRQRLTELREEQSRIENDIEGARDLLRENEIEFILKMDEKKKVEQAAAKKTREMSARKNRVNDLCRQWLQLLTVDLTRGTLPSTVLRNAELDLDAEFLSDDVAKEKYLELDLDYADLTEEMKNANTGESRNILERLTLSLSEVNAKLSEGCPLTDLENLMDVTEIDAELKTLSETRAKTHAELRTINEEFNKVFAERKQRLMVIVEFIRNHLSDTYRRLNSNLPDAECHAYLDFIDDNDPFHGGIKFTGMPYGKRYQEVAQMSEGERTVAALALLFTIHKWIQPPFLILDEVDAYLDANSISLLLRYIKDAPFQTIAISLKWRFFSTADALIGVIRKREGNSSLYSSTFYSLDLKCRAAPVTDQENERANRAAPLTNELDETDDTVPLANEEDNRMNDHMDAADEKDKTADNAVAATDEEDKRTGVAVRGGDEEDERTDGAVPEADTADEARDNAAPAADEEDEKIDVAALADDKEDKRTRNAGPETHEVNKTIDDVVSPADEEDKRTDDAVPMAEEVDERTDDAVSAPGEKDKRTDDAVSVAEKVNKRTDDAVSAPGEEDKRANDAVPVAEKVNKRTVDAVSAADEEDNKTDHALKVVEKVEEKTHDAVPLSDEMNELKDEPQEYDAPKKKNKIRQNKKRKRTAKSSKAVSKTKRQRRGSGSDKKGTGMGSHVEIKDEKDEPQAHDTLKKTNC